MLKHTFKFAGDLLKDEGPRSRLLRPFQILKILVNVFEPLQALAEKYKAVKSKAHERGTMLEWIMEFLEADPACKPGTDEWLPEDDMAGIDETVGGEEEVQQSDTPDIVHRGTASQPSVEFGEKHADHRTEFLQRRSVMLAARPNKIW